MFNVTVYFPRRYNDFCRRGQTSRFEKFKLCIFNGPFGWENRASVGIRRYVPENAPAAVALTPRFKPFFLVRRPRPFTCRMPMTKTRRPAILVITMDGVFQPWSLRALVRFAVSPGHQRYRHLLQSVYDTSIYSHIVTLTLNLNAVFSRFSPDSYTVPFTTSSYLGIGFTISFLIDDD